MQTKFLIGCLLALSITMHAQLGPLDYLEKYNDENVVVLNDVEKVEIGLGKEGLEIEEKILRETVYLSEIAATGGSRSVSYTEDFYEIKDLRVYTYFPENNDYKKSRVSDFVTREVMSDNVFYDGQMAILYSLPAMPKGCKSVLEYSRVIKDPRFVGVSFFQNQVITENQKFEIEVDNDVELQIDYFNCSPSDFTFTTEVKRGKTLYNWERNNIEKLEMERGAPSFRSLAPHIVYRIKNYKLDGETKQVLNSVDDLFSWYSTLVEDARMDKDSDLDTLVRNIISGAKTDYEKASIIYKWVQKNIKYIAVEDGLGGFKPRMPSTTFSNRYGDCKDMSSLLVNMLSTAGLEASYTWIGTRSIPYTYEQVPTPMNDNHMIACLKLNGKYIFMDATSSHLPFDYPSQFIQGKEALIYISKDSFDIAEVPVVPAKTNFNGEKSVLNLVDGLIKGKGTSTLKGYYAEYYIQNTEGTNDSKQKKKFVERVTYKGNNEFQLKDYSVDSLLADKVMLSFEYELPSYYHSAGDEIFVNLNLERPFADDEIEKDRKLPIQYNHKLSITREVVLNVPEGYALSYLPENSESNFEDFWYRITYEAEGNQVHYKLQLEINELLIEKDSFENWNSLLTSLKSAYNESLLLKLK